MADVSSIGFAAAFGAGVISFLSPCVLPLVPAYVSYVAGDSAQRARLSPARERLAALRVSAPFVAGFSAVFIALGASASALGLLLQRYRYEANLVAGTVVIAFGLFMLGLWRWVPWLQRDLRLHLRLAGGNPLAGFVLGTAFAFGWTPCIGPILGAILAMTAVRTGAGGVGLLSAYSLGLGLPFLLTALFIGRATRLFSGLRRIGAGLQIGGGIVLVALGVAMLTGELTVFSRWLLDTVPALGRIG
jgi:cytochrome c-type biogenesis protein